MKARLNSVQTKLGTHWDPSPAWQSVISGVQFNAFGAVTSLNHLGLTESRTYNVLGQMTRMTKGSLIDVEYRFSATANDGKILSQKNWLCGEDVTYQYDELERLISASTTAGGNWGLSWAYDGFGNRLSQTVTQGAGPSSVTLVNGNTNRISSAGYAYDPNGNMTVMPKGSGSMTLNYDLSNRVSGLSHPDGSEQYRYAPDNRRVWRSAGRTACYASRGNDQQLYWAGNNGYGGVAEGATEQIIFYSPGGQKMGAYCLGFSPNMQHFAVTASEENVYYGGRLVGKRMAVQSVANSGVVSAFTADRLQSKGNGSNYYPYGESKTSTSGDDREGFATYTRDEKSGLDYADQRWYASGVGRFSSPDPYKSNSGGAGDIQDSRSWNKYSYVLSDPISFHDPEGLIAYVPNQQPPPPPPPSAPPTAIPSGPNALNQPSLEAPPTGDLIAVAGWPGFESAIAALKEDQCAKALGAQGSKEATAKLNSTIIKRSDDLPFSAPTVTINMQPNGSWTYSWAIDHGRNEVASANNGEILLSGSYLDAGSLYNTKSILPDGSLLYVNLMESLASAWGLKYGGADGASPDDVWGLYILHELGHLMNGLPSDLNAPSLSQANTRKVIENCYKRFIK